MASQMNLPMLLTLSRIAAAPLLLWLLPAEGDGLRWLSTLVFLLAAGTDYLDGYLARKGGLVTKLGASLDETADKILTLGALLALLLSDSLGFWAALMALLIIGRDLLIAGLRSAGTGVNLGVTMVAKVKSAMLFLALSLWILNAPGLVGLALLALLISTGLSLWTGWHYLKVVLARFD